MPGYRKRKRPGAAWRWRTLDDFDPGLRAAINAASSITKLARLLDISTQAICQWNEVPVNRVLDVERLTGVARELLRPDFYRPAGNSPSRKEVRAMQVTINADTMQVVLTLDHMQVTFDLTESQKQIMQHAVGLDEAIATANAPAPTPTPKPRRSPVIRRRGRGPWRLWSEADKQQLQVLDADKVPSATIARKLGRTLGAVRSERARQQQRASR
jgi:DNA-binding transcriptional regulator YdaS (Cro superfamily)